MSREPLGRALLGVANDERHLFLDIGDGDWHNAGWGALRRAEVDAELHDVREVLLVSPAPARVLAAAVAEWLRRLTSPSPEPDSGTGWDRDVIAQFCDWWREDSPHGEPHEVTAIADQAEALLADRDQWREAALASGAQRIRQEALDSAMAEVGRLVDERDAARSETTGVREELTRTADEVEDLRATLAMRDRQLAEALNDVDDRDATIGTLRDDLNHQTGAAIDNAATVARLEGELVSVRSDNDRLRDHGVLKGDALDAALADVDRLRAELATARREAADATELLTSCEGIGTTDENPTCLHLAARHPNLFGSPRAICPPCRREIRAALDALALDPPLQWTAENQDWPDGDL